MGLLDTVKGWFGGGKAKVQGTVATHSDTIKGGIDKAGSVVDDKTGGKYTDKVTTAQEKGKDLVDGLAGNKPAGGQASAPDAATDGPAASDPATSGPETPSPETPSPETTSPETNGTAEPPA
jgi:hypothetical protein